MTTTQKLYNLDVPDELSGLDLKDAKPEELFKACYDVWRSAMARDDNHCDSYETACKIVRPHADKLVNVFKEDTYPVPPLERKADMYEIDGIFLSAIINNSSEQEIDFNFEVVLDYLAYRLPKGKVFVNYRKAGKRMGHSSEGIVLNRGTAEDAMGEKSKGLVVNFGKADTGLHSEMGKGAEGVVVNCGEMMRDGSMGADAVGVMINFGEAPNGIDEGFCGNTKALRYNSKESMNCTLSSKYRKDAAVVAYFDKFKAALYKGKDNTKILLKLPNSQKIRDDIDAIRHMRGSK